MGCKLRRKVKGKPCVHYIKPGLCALPQFFRCIEYVEKFEPQMSYSSLMSFLRCRRKWYIEEILGLEPIEEMVPLPLKRGKDMHRALAMLIGEEDIQTFSLSPQDEQERVEIRKIDALIGAMEELSLHEPLRGQVEREFMVVEEGLPKLHGFIDVVGDDWFAEFKYTGRPQEYLHPTFAKSQLAIYFLALPDADKALMRPIRVPQMRPGANEDLDRYTERLREDILRRPAFYFPNYDSKRRTWGSSIYRTEIEFAEVKERLRWAVREIKRMVKEGSYFRNETACFFPDQCPYLQLCETGLASPLLYRRKGDKQVGDGKTKPEGVAW